MRPNYFAIIERAFYRIVGRVSHSLGYGPLGGSEFLRLYSTEPTHNIDWSFEFSRTQPLIPETLIYNQ